MATLRTRIYAASGLLIGLQVAGTVLGFASWGEVRKAAGAEERIAVDRERLNGLGAAAREIYVHEAHTLIEQGPAHLDHLVATEAEVETQLVSVGDLARAYGADIDGIRRAIAESNAWFAA